MPRQSFEDVLGKEFAEHVARAHFVIRALCVPTHTNVKITKEAKGTYPITYALTCKDVARLSSVLKGKVERDRVVSGFQNSFPFHSFPFVSCCLALPSFHPSSDTLLPKYNN